MSALDELGRKPIYAITHLELCVLAMRGYQGDNSVSEKAAEELERLRYELAIKDAELRRRLELAEAKEYE